jgi:ketosteroid isomerase-like protein
VRQVFERIVNQGDLAFVDEVYAPGFVDHSAWPGQAPGPAGIRDAIRDLRAMLPDLRVTVEQLIAEGDDVATRERWRATDAPTGQPITGAVMHIF